MIRKEFQKIRKCPINWTQEELIMTSVNYKVGDVVKVREDLAPGEYYGGIYLVRDMLQYDKVRISYVYDDKYAVDEDAYVYTDEMLDKLVERGYTEDDIKVGMRLKCISTSGDWWIVGKTYTVNDNLEIYDESGDVWNDYEMTNVLNCKEVGNFTKFEIVEDKQYELSDLKWGTKLKCTKSPYSWWTVGEIYVMDGTLAIYDNDGARWSNYDILDRLNDKSGRVKFEIIDDAEGDKQNEDTDNVTNEEYKYTTDDIKVGMSILCKISTFGHWIEGNEYVVDDNLCIYDEDGELRDVGDIVYYLNKSDGYLTFALCDQDVGKLESIDIDSPNYYTSGIETKDYIRSHNLNFNRGSAVKYATRAGKKHPDKEIEDLKKAINFLQFEIDYLENNK